MASNYTENYGLCQWEATDQVLRTDFNGDNAKIDDALTQFSTEIAKKVNQSLFTNLQAQVNGAAYYRTGTYTGNGSSQRIYIGSMPTAVFITVQDHMATMAIPAVSNSMISFNNAGFEVTQTGDTNQINNSGTIYGYLAFFTWD